MGDIVKVGMADMNTCVSPDCLTTLGLGSCVGVAIRDPVSKVGGLAHVMLPDSTKIKNNSNIYKFADTCIDALVKEMIKKGANKHNLVAKIAGGAQMFAFQNKTDMIRVGEQNVMACRNILKELGIPILSEDVGLNYGRTVVFYPEDGRYVIKSVGKEDKVI